MSEFPQVARGERLQSEASIVSQAQKKELGPFLSCEGVRVLSAVTHTSPSAVAMLEQFHIYSSLPSPSLLCALGNRG